MGKVTRELFLNREKGWKSKKIKDNSKKIKDKNNISIKNPVSLTKSLL